MPAANQRFRHPSIAGPWGRLLQASSAAQPEKWLDDYLSERSDCRVCGERYRIENLALCTLCRQMVCHRCAAAGMRAVNGNYACVCGGEFVG